MPIFGENIGRAYVEVIASGDGLDESIRREFHDSEPTVREGGRMHGQVYGEEFDRAVQHSFEEQQQRTFGEMGEDLTRNLRQALQRVEVGRVFFESDEWQKFRTQLEHESGDAGALAGRQLEREFGDNFNIDRLTARINNIGPDIRRAQAKILDDLHSDALRRNDEFDRNIASQQKRLLTLFREYEQELGRMERGEKGVHHTRQSLITDFEHLRGLFSSMTIHGGPLSTMGDDFTDIEKRLGRLDTTTTRWRTSLHNLNDRIDRFGDSVGRAFGAHSRNNFLNIFGRIIGAGVTLPGVFTRIGESVLGMIDHFRELRQASGVMGAIGITAAQAVAGIVALGVAISVIIVVIGPLIALVAGLAGILLALASTVALAAAAIGGVLVGAIGPLVLGLGVLVLAITDLVKHAGPLSGALNTLKTDFRGLANTARDAAFARLPQQLTQLHGILKGLDPLVRAVGKGIASMIDELLNAFQSPAFVAFRDTFERAMPGIMRRLGSITGNAFRALFGIFRALLPLVQQFLRWLDRITGNFADWINSARGQTAVKDFFDRAADSAKSLGNFIREAIGLVSDLITHGADAGDGMFDGMTRSLQKFRTFLAEPLTPPTPMMGGRPDPTGELPEPSQGLTRLDKFFQFAQDLADALGEAARKALKLMDTLDSPDAQNNLINIINLLGTLTQAANDAANAIDLFINPAGAANNSWVQSLGQQIRDKVGGAWDWVREHSRSAFSAGDLIKPPNLTKIAAGFAGLAGIVVKKIGKIDVGGMVTGAAKAAGKLVGDFSGTSSKVFNKVKTNVSGMISGTASAVSHLISGFTGTAAKVFSKVKTNVSGMIDGAGTAVSHLVSSFAGVSGRVLNNVRTNVSNMISGAADAASRLVDAFRGLAGRIVAAIGTIVPHIEIHMPHIPGTAVGGIFDRPQFRQIAEAGTEAVVPLDRPLSMVDPAVRELSAFAQGKRSPSGGIGGKTVTNNFHVTTPTTDPFAVAVETVNYMTAVGGY